MNYRKLATDMQPQVVQWRRYLHQHAELSWQERQTGDWLAERLRDMGLEPRRVAGTGVTADIGGGRSGPRVALRADMDALAIVENTGLSFASQNQGVMHACGHDAHMAMLLGAAAVLAKHRQQIAGHVRLLFQPAEETPPPGLDVPETTGAKVMVDEGVMEVVQSVVGIHVFSNLPLGLVNLVSGPAMAGSQAFDVTIKGRGGHAGKPDDTVDALAVAAHIIVALRSAMTLGTDPMDPVIIHVGMVASGTMRTAIAAEAKLGGTIRFMNEDALPAIEEKIRRLIDGVAVGFGAEARLEWVAETNPPVVNDPRMIANLRRLAAEVVGAERVIAGRPGMVSEDFSFYQQKAPGAFIALGCGNPAGGLVAGHHSPEFDIDEDCLPLGVEIWLRIGFNPAQLLAKES